MRTALTIDEDVLITARKLAAEEGTSVGKVISRVVRIEMDRMRTTGEFIPSVAISPRADGEEL